jgi:hypothetical protein
MGFAQVLVVSAVVMGLAHTLTRERIFEPLRLRLGHRRHLGYLVTCPYCASHWIAFLLVPMTRAYGVRAAPGLGPLAGLTTWFLSSILVTVLAAAMRVVFYFLDEGQALTRRHKQLVEAEADDVHAGSEEPEIH